MVIDFTPEQEARLLEAAQRNGRDIREVVAETVIWLSSLEEEYERSVREAQIAEAEHDNAEWISHEEAGRKMGLA